MVLAFIRAKRVMHPLDDKVKALLHGGGGGGGGEDDENSSSSQHGGDGSSVQSNQIHGSFFLFHSGEQESLLDKQTSVEDPTTTSSSAASEIVRDMITSMINDEYRKELLAVVSAAQERLRLGALQQSPAATRTTVMGCLRDYGYNAGICQTTYAGDYEYIDLIRSDRGGEERFIVELDFAGEFEIARPSGEYVKLIEDLPKVYIGTVEEVKKMVGVMTANVKRSMTARKMHVPPWRKVSFMRNKWLGIYKRSTNFVMSVTTPMKMQTPLRVHCQAVGFVPTRSFRVPSTASIM